jgi:hypothetical protein
MADDEWDMSASTQQFQAFARSGEGEPVAARGPNVGLIACVGALAVVAAIAVVAFVVI